MLTDLLAFLTVLDFDHKRPDQIRAVKLKELIEDIQMRKRFIGFIFVETATVHPENYVRSFFSHSQTRNKMSTQNKVFQFLTSFQNSDV